MSTRFQHGSALAVLVIGASVVCLGAAFQNTQDLPTAVVPGEYVNLAVPYAGGLEMANCTVLVRETRANWARIAWRLDARCRVAWRGGDDYWINPRLVWGIYIDLEETPEEGTWALFWINLDHVRGVS